MKKIAVLIALLAATPAHANGDGMYLCHTPATASAFWSDLVNARSNGAALTQRVSLGVAKKNQCEFVASEGLKPVDYVANQLSVTDGRANGWVDPHYFIYYVNQDSLSAAEAGATH